MVEICAKAAVGNPEELGDCPFCQRVIVTLKEKDVDMPGLDMRLRSPGLDVDYQLNLINLDDKPQWFIDECPSGEVPAMKHEGRWVDDVQIIIGMIEEWYPEPRLATPDEFAEAEHRFQNLYGYFVGFLQSQDPDDGTLQALQEELNALDEHLGENWLVTISRIIISLKICPIFVPTASRCGQGHLLRTPLPQMNILLQDGTKTQSLRANSGLVIDEIPSRELPAMKNEHGHWILQAEEICRIIEELHPEPSLDTPPHLVGVGCNIFGNFEAFLESDDPDDGTEQALLDELEAFDEHIRENGPYIAGEDVTALDFSLTPGLLHVPVALPHFKNWEIPEHLTHVRGYLELMLSRPSFEKTTPEDQYIIAGWEQKLNC
ncbi:hypothetical protein ACLB2K_069744 [Fragaria x ananassa]